MIDKPQLTRIALCLALAPLSAILSACGSSAPNPANTPTVTLTHRIPGTPTVVIPVATPTSIATLGPLPTSGAISDTRPLFAPYKEPAVDVAPALVDQPIAPDLSNVLVPFVLSTTQKTRLAQDGVVAAPSSNGEFFLTYEQSRYRNVPVFVTSDSLLHAYHLLFDKVLRTAETETFSTRLKALNAALLERADGQYRSLQGTDWTEPARRSVAYIGVGSKLLDSRVVVPAYAQDLVDEEVALINAHDAVLPSPIFPGLQPGEDYTQYIPRGHYTMSEELTAYFRSMMWYGRMTFRLTPDDPAVGRDETRSALLLAQALRTAQVDGKPAIETWMDIYYPTAFFVGSANNLTVVQYSQLMDKVYGTGITAADLQNEALLDQFIQQAAQLEPGQSASVIPSDSTNLDPTRKGLQLMGQRFVPDTYIFRSLLYDDVGTGAKPRLLPKGLDVMAAFGSQRAYSVLEEMGETQYANYPEQMAKMQEWVSGLTTDDWTGTLYTTWLYTFPPLLDAPGNGYPQFMRSTAWRDKQLNTALGSWAELRHDTILYAQPGYPEAGGGMFVPEPLLARGYVEPVPLFYARLRALAAMTRTGLASRGLLGQQDDDGLRQLETIAQSLQTISEKELRGQPLSDNEHELIRSYGVALENLLVISLGTETVEGRPGIWYDHPPQGAIVADVASAGDVALEEATGNVNDIFVVVPLVNPDGSTRIEVARGGMFSYYEFSQPSNDRLTDEAWQEMLTSGRAPAPPQWTGSFLTAETEYAGLQIGVYSLESSLGISYWYKDVRYLGTSDQGVQDQFTALFKELTDKKQEILRTFVSASYRSYDFQSEDAAVVTVRETWQDKLYPESGRDEYGAPKGDPLGTRGPFTLDVTYTLQRTKDDYNPTRFYWHVTRVVYANQPPDWNQ